MNMLIFWEKFKDNLFLRNQT